MKRTPLAPDLPTIDELGLKGFETSVWFAISSAGGHAARRDRELNSATHAVLDSPEMQEQFRAQGIEVIKSSPDQLAGYIRSETSKWAKVIQSAGIKPE